MFYDFLWLFIRLWVADWEGRTSSFRNPNQKRAGLWWIFSSSNSAPANRKTGFYANREPNKQEVGFIFALSGSELCSLVKYSRSKKKKKKKYSGWCPFKVLSNDTTLMQIQSFRTVPLIRYFTEGNLYLRMYKYPNLIYKYKPELVSRLGWWLQLKRTQSTIR